MIDIIWLMNEWQKPSDKLVHVSHFRLEPQSQGFMLNLEVYIAGKYDPELGYEDKDFYGTLEECFYQAVGYLESEKARLSILL